MPTAVKPCEGRFSPEVIELLVKNRDRAQWANHPCEVCGLSIGATLDKGRWVPEQHWPTVKYLQHRTHEKKSKSAAKAPESDEAEILAESTAN